MHPEHRTLRQQYFPLLAQIIVRDGYVCACCEAYRPLVVDHIVSVKQGGITEIENLQLLCHRCNGIKGSTTVDYRPDNRGGLGLEVPRWAASGALIIRTFTYRHGRTEGFYVVDHEVIHFRAKDRIKLRRLYDGKVINTDLKNVYPPDLQHIY